MERSSAGRELLRMIWERKAWAILPATIAVLLVAGLIIFASAIPQSPFTYPVQ